MSIINFIIALINFGLFIILGVIGSIIYFLLCPYMDEDVTFTSNADNLSHFNQFL